MLWHLYLSGFWSRFCLLVFILKEMLQNILWLLGHVFDICLWICRCSYTCLKIFYKTSLLICLKSPLVFYSWLHRLKIIKLDEIHTVLRVHSEIQLCILLPDCPYFHLHSSQNIIIFCDYIFSVLSKLCLNRWIFSDNIAVSSSFLMCYQVQDSSHPFHSFCKIEE